MSLIAVRSSVCLLAAILTFLACIGIGAASEDIELIVEYPGSCRSDSTKCETRSCTALLNAIQRSEQSIEFAVYGMRGVKHILEALLDVANRGVHVRGVVDQEVDGSYSYVDTETWKESLHDIRTDRDSEKRLHVEARKYRAPRCPKPVIQDPITNEVFRFEGPRQCLAYETRPNRWRISTHASRKPLSSRMRIMHHKFFVFDRNEVWTGSANLSETGIGGCNANVVLHMRSEEVAKRYRSEFETMWNGYFHEEKIGNARSSRNKTAAPIRINKDTLLIEFSPQGRAVSEIRFALDQAESMINVGVFFLTHKSLTCALVAARNRGVSVRIVLDATGAKNEYTKHRILRDAGIPVKVENWSGKMHMKAASIDGETLIAGSMNWTAAGERVNDENTVVIQSTRLAQEFDGHFDALWNSIPDRWSEDRPDPESKESIGSCEDERDNDFDKDIDALDQGCSQYPPPLPPLPPERNVSEPPDTYWQCPLKANLIHKVLSRYDDNRNGRISCAEAERHGLTPVRRGDPAYSWMRDADEDGVVCESKR